MVADTRDVMSFMNIMSFSIIEGLETKVHMVSGMICHYAVVKVSKQVMHDKK